MAGTSVWLWRDRIPVNNTLAILILVVTLGSTQIPPFFILLTPFTVCYMVLWVGFVFRIKGLTWCDTTDLSYGIYLFAFPIQEALAGLGMRNPWLMFVVATPITMGIAFLCWNLVEKPCLKLKSKGCSTTNLGRVASPERTATAAASKINW